MIHKSEMKKQDEEKLKTKKQFFSNVSQAVDFLR